MLVNQEVNQINEVSFLECLFLSPPSGGWVSGRPETAGRNAELAELKGPERTQLPFKTLSLEEGGGFEG